MTPDHPHMPHTPSGPPNGGIDTGGVLLAIGIYVMAVVLGWAMVGVLLALWWGR